MTKEYAMKGNVWLYPGESGNWHFVTLPTKESREIKETRGKAAKGFGSLPVTVTIGKTSWNTSIFPDSRSGCYLLPLKLSVRKKEGIAIDDTITFTITLR